MASYDLFCEAEDSGPFGNLCCRSRKQIGLLLEEFSVIRLSPLLLDLQNPKRENKKVHPHVVPSCNFFYYDYFKSSLNSYKIELPGIPGRLRFRLTGTT